jgi:hypothetical protein
MFCVDQFIKNSDILNNWRQWGGAQGRVEFHVRQGGNGGF